MDRYLVKALAAQADVLSPRLCPSCAGLLRAVGWGSVNYRDGHLVQVQVGRGYNADRARAAGIRCRRGA